MADLEKRKIFSNAAVSLIQVVVIGLVMFVQYRYLLGVVGIRGLGIWSLVLAATAATEIANLGLSASVVKFVAKYLAREDAGAVDRLIQTAAMTVGISVGLLLAAAYPLLRLVLRLVVSPESLAGAWALLPYTLIAFWFLALTGIYQAGLDGFQRMDVRGLILMGAALVHLAACVLLAPRFGLIGLGYARILQNSLTLIASWVLLRKKLPRLHLIPRFWDKALFREMIGYGASFQAVSILSMFCDPLTKALLSRFGGLSHVGYYEMANRMVLQFRALLVSANQAVVPAIARLVERVPGKVAAVFRTSFDLMFYLALPMFAGMAVGAPLISRLWLGRYEPSFVVFTVFLAAGYLCNTLAVPAYFANMGIGELRWNLRSHIAMAGLNPLLSFALGWLWDGFGVVGGWGLTLVLSAGLLLGAYFRRHALAARVAWPAASGPMAAACLGSLVLAAAAQLRFPERLNAVGFSAALILPAAILIWTAAWLHPMRKRLWSWVKYDLAGADRKALEHA